MIDVPLKRLLVRYVNVTKEVAQTYRPLAIKEVGPLTCHAGCAFCCYQKIVAGIWDGLPIYLWLKERGLWTPEYRQRLILADAVETSRTHRGHLMARIPCVFLAEEKFGQGRCTVYPVRPIACASTFSTEPDPSACASHDESNQFAIRTRELDLKHSKLLHEMIRHTGIPMEPNVCTMPGAVLLAEAIVEGLPRPDVRMVKIVTPAIPRVTEIEFDKAATVPDGE